MIIFKWKMRLLSIILSIHVLFLTASPALSVTFVSAENNECKKSCCSSEKETQKSTEQNNDCCNVCNPFMICCNCFALITQPQDISVPFIYVNQKFNLLSETNNSDFLSDAWNPPKVV